MHIPRAVCQIDTGGHHKAFVSACVLPPAVRCLGSLRMWRSSKNVLLRGCIVEGIKRSNNMCGSRNFKRIGGGGGGGGGGAVAIFFKRGRWKRSKYLGQFVLAKSSPKGGGGGGGLEPPEPPPPPPPPPPPIPTPMLTIHQRMLWLYTSTASKRIEAGLMYCACVLCSRDKK